MPERIIPDRPNLEQYRKQAKELLRAAKAGEQPALARMHKNHPHLREAVTRERQAHKFALADAQLVIAREHGHPSWPVFAKQVESARIMGSVEAEDAVNTFIDVAS